MCVCMCMYILCQIMPRASKLPGRRRSVVFITVLSILAPAPFYSTYTYWCWSATRGTITRAVGPQGRPKCGMKCSAPLCIESARTEGAPQREATTGGEGPTGDPHGTHTDRYWQHRDKVK